MSEALEIKVGEKTFPVAKFLSYGNDKKFFAIVGNDLYYNTPGGYELLQKDFSKEEIN